MCSTTGLLFDTSFDFIGRFGDASNVIIPYPLTKRLRNVFFTFTMLRSYIAHYLYTRTMKLHMYKYEIYA